jgi:hypothetical protein
MTLAQWKPIRGLVEWLYTGVTLAVVVGVPAVYHLATARVTPGDVIAAVDRGEVDRLVAMLDSGASPNARDEEGRTPLTAAACDGSLEAAQLLLSRGADANACDGAGSALFHAAAGGHVEIVEALLAHGADPRRTFEACDALAASLSGGSVRITRALLAHGADPGAATFRCNAFAYVDERSVEAVDALLEAGCDPTRVGADGMSGIESLREQGATECLARIARYAAVKAVVSAGM